MRGAFRPSALVEEAGLSDQQFESIKQSLVLVAEAVGGRREGEPDEADDATTERPAPADEPSDESSSE